MKYDEIIYKDRKSGLIKGTWQSGPAHPGPFLKAKDLSEGQKVVALGCRCNYEKSDNLNHGWEIFEGVISVRDDGERYISISEEIKKERKRPRGKEQFDQCFWPSVRYILRKEQSEIIGTIHDKEEL